MAKRHRYTPEEMDLVRSMYATHSAAEIATRIFGKPRAALAIYRLAYAMGLRKWPRLDPKFIAAVKRLHGKGLNDVEIANKLDSTRNCVHALRYERLKLPDNCTGEKRKEVGRRAIKTQFERLGIRHGGDLRALAFKRYARENGWPENLPPRAVQILNVLTTHGPQTAKQLAAKIGLPAKTQAHRIPLRWSSGTGMSRGQGGTYTAMLQRRSLVVRLRRYTTGRGQGKNTLSSLYMLGPAAIAILEQRAKEQCNVSAKRVEA